MDITVFYSWQSDTDPGSNRWFIEDCLKYALSNANLGSDYAIEPTLDRDTLDVAGSPGIADTILSKIEGCDVFVADVSIIGQVTASEGKKPRLTPNPNVLLELGYAARCLTWNAIILVANNAYGQIEDLPFDLRGRRAVKYHLQKGQAKQDSKRHLSRVFSDALLAILGHDPHKRRRIEKILSSAHRLLDEMKWAIVDERWRDNELDPLQLVEQGAALSSVLTPGLVKAVSERMGHAFRTELMNAVERVDVLVGEWWTLDRSKAKERLSQSIEEIQRLVATVKDEFRLK